jgi:CBS domain-containing protein
MKVACVKDLMTSNPEAISPDETIKGAAQRMKELNCGLLLVGTEHNLSGVITDRDIVVRAIAEGKDPSEESVEDYISNPIYSCSEADTLEDAITWMQKTQVSRLIVKDKKGDVSGVISLGDILRHYTSDIDVAKAIKLAKKVA